ncbi:hypothetical protein Tco_0429025, partial [Tanacetum coccineum]
MSMTIQSSVKDKILATSSETSKVENAPAEMLRDLDQQMEKMADDDAAETVRDMIGFIIRAFETPEKVVMIKEKLKVARDRQKSCADNRRKPNVGPLRILKMSGLAAIVEMLEELSGVHDTFHVSNL